MHHDEDQALAFARCDAAFAFRFLEFAVRIENHLSLDGFDFKAFGQDTAILLDTKNIGFKDEYFASKENSLQVAAMGISAAFGVSAIALDDYFEVARGERNPASTEVIDSLWAVVYAVRNAFAHGIANPKWGIKQHYRREYRI